MLRRLVLALALVAGAAFAHRPFSPPNVSPIRQGLVDTVEGFTLDEIIAWSDAQFARAARFGRYVRWGGTIALASTAVLGALDWFYNEVKRESGTSLDEWWNMGLSPSGVIPATAWSQSLRLSSCDIFPTYWVDTPSGSSSQQYTDYGLYCSSHPTMQEMLQHAVQAKGGDGWLITYPDTVQAQKTGGGVISGIQAIQLTGQVRPPLPDWLQTHPDAADGVKQAFREYITENDPQSFSQPWPGVQLDPVPTGNQWWDNPFFNPLEDTDQDGWPDWMEWDLESDPANPAKQPLPTADPDGDGYDNASERDAMTDPTDPSSRPDVGSGDSDQDGMPDSSDPCPDDPNNQCQPDEKPEEIPDPSIPTLRTPDMPALDHGPFPEVSQRIASFKQHVQEQLDSLWDTVQDRFPFGMARWVPAPPSGVGSDCPPIIDLRLTFGGQQVASQVDICNTPPYQWMQSTGRTLLIPVVLISSAFAVLRRSSDA